MKNEFYRCGVPGGKYMVKKKSAKAKRKTSVFSTILFVVVIIVSLIIGVLIGGHSELKKVINPEPNPIIEPSKAEEQKEKERFVTVINETNNIIEELVILVSEGTVVTKKSKIDDESTTIKISDAYKDYSIFTITVTDNYGYLYKKEIFDLPKQGVTEVKITTDNRVEQKGDGWRRIEEFFNELSK